MTLIDILVYVALAAGAALLLWLIISGRFSAKGNTFASLTAFHDLQPKDRRNAVEVIIETKAGKRLLEQSSGQPKGKRGEVDGGERKGHS